jgi:CHAD domain-containing protein
LGYRKLADSLRRHEHEGGRQQDAGFNMPCSSNLQGWLEVIRDPHFHNFSLDRDRLNCRLGRCELRRVEFRDAKDRYAREPGNDLFEQPHLFAAQLREIKKHSRQIAARARKTFDISFGKRIALQINSNNRSARPNASGVAVLARDLRKRRKNAFARAQTAIGSARFRDLVLDTAAWIEAGEWTHNDDKLARALRERPIAASAAEELRRYRKKILNGGARLDELEPQRRHKLRIRAKKLRYASEFFAGAFPNKKSSRRREEFVAGLEKLQDALGDLNDIAVHEGLTERIIDAQDANGKRRRGRAKKAFAAGRLSGREEARIEPVLKDAQRAYRVLAKAKPFWP